MVARMGISHPWGVVAAEFDDAALALAPECHPSGGTFPGWHDC
jgi:hypothetical protein